MAAAAQPADDGLAQPLNLTPGLDVCPVVLAEVANGPPLALFADGLDTALYRVDPGSHRFRRVSARPGRLDPLTASASGRRSSCWRAPHRAAGRVHRTAGRPAGESATRGRRPAGAGGGIQERLSYQAPDGLALDGLLILR